MKRNEVELQWADGQKPRKPHRLAVMISVLLALAVLATCFTTLALAEREQEDSAAPSESEAPTQAPEESEQPSESAAESEEPTQEADVPETDDDTALYAARAATDDAVYERKADLNSVYRFLSATCGDTHRVWLATADAGNLYKFQVILQDSNGNTIASGKKNDIYLYGIFEVNSDYFWYEVVRTDNITLKAASSNFSRNLNYSRSVNSKTSVIGIRAYTNVTYSDTSYCTVRQPCVLTLNGKKENRTVKIFADGNYVGEWTGLFPNRYGMNASDLSVQLYGPYYRSNVRLENGYYRVDIYSHYNITASVNGGHGTASVAATPIDKYGSTTVSFNAATGYLIDYLTDNGSRVDIDDAASYTYTVGNITENRNIVAYTTPIRYQIAYDLGGGSAENPTSYTIEDSVTLNAPTRANAKFLGWTGSNGSTPQLSVTIPKGSTGNRTYTANWTAAYHVIGGIGKGTVTNGDQYVYPGEQSLPMEFVPEEGNEIIGVWVNSVQQTVTDPLHYVFPAQTVNSDITVVVGTKVRTYTVTVHHYLEGTTRSVHEDTYPMVNHGEALDVAAQQLDLTFYAYVSCSPESLTVTESGLEACVYYRANTSSITVRQDIPADTLGDRTKAFDFTLTCRSLAGKTVDSLTFDENGTAHFSLRHGESLTVEGLPAGAAYSIEEAAPTPYSVTYTIDGGTSVSGSRAAINELSVQGAEVKFTNVYTYSPPTGVFTENMTGTLLLIGIPALALAAFLVLAVLRRRKQHN